MARLTSVVAVVLFAVACEPSDDTTQGDQTPPPSVTDTDDPVALPVTASGVASPHVSSVLVATIDGPEGEATVEYGVDDFSLVTPASAAALHHEIAVIGLKPARTYQWRAVVVDPEGDRHESAVQTFDVPALPTLLAPLEVLVDEPEAGVEYFAANLVRTGVTSFIGIVDRDGDWVWWVDTGGWLATTVKLSSDGRSVLYNFYDFAHEEDTGGVVRIALDGRSRTETFLPLSHHDYVDHDDGTFAYLSREYGDFVVGPSLETVLSDIVAIAPEGMTAPGTFVPIFSMFDDHPLEPVFTCPHMQSEGPEFGYTGVHDWTHGNSLVHVPDAGAYYLLQKFSDWLIKIDDTTGAVAWTMNGRESDFTQPNGDPVWTDPNNTSLWSHAHLSELWDGGALVFDNGDHHVPPLSSAIEVAWDEQAMTAEVVWSFPHPDGGQTGTMGDVRRLPNGNRLITWSDLGSVTEVTPDGRIVWEADIPQNPTRFLGRLVPLDGLN
jgi:hypothetical protein